MGKNPSPTLFDRVEILKSFSLSGRIVPELNNRNIRELIIGNYRIIYRISSNDRIDILTVYHSKRILKNSPTFDD